MSDSKDLFSGHSGAYAAFRPTYPRSLYEFILSHVKTRTTAWDCGCGNGQVAVDLAAYFEKVYATDLSAKQIENATPVSNISYSVSKAEHTSFADNTFDLITVGQALHWFDLPLFYKEVQRVARQDAIIAVWGYGLLQINKSIDYHIQDFYTNIIGPYWDKERKLVDERYNTISFPFDEITSPPFTFSFDWTLEQLEGYLNTWSSVQKYIHLSSKNPVTELIIKIKSLWVGDTMEIEFPLFVRIGRVHQS